MRDDADALGMDSPALLLVDLQEDFLARPGLTPSRARITERASALLAGCRARAVPVLHVRTLVHADGSDAMPHWKRRERLECVAGSAGARAPAALGEQPGEGVYHKRFFGAFGAPGLAEQLRELRTRSLVLAGIYLHSCVRETALEAYERGFEVWIAEDAVGSTEPVHAEITRSYLRERAAHFARTATLLQRLDGAHVAPPATEVFPVASIAGEWRAADGHEHVRLSQPADLRSSLGLVPLAGPAEVAAAAAAARAAQPIWSRWSAAQRRELLARWSARIAEQQSAFADLLVREIGKPRAEAAEEVARAAAHAASAARLLEARDVEHRVDGAGGAGGAGPHVRQRPLGTVALVTPWNNPLAIPVGKLAPALAFGNAVVWKPACEAPRTALALLATLLELGPPPGTVALVFGAADTARHLIAERAIDALSLTGSIETGRNAAALCAVHGKSLQAELGGNNAAIVLADCDLEAEARNLALAAFSFAGQRCTATRRILVERSILEPFTAALTAAVSALRVGDPARDDTQVGPLISEESRRRIAAALEQARSEGGRILCGGNAPREPAHGCYFLPTLVADLAPGASLVQEETFGPVAVVLAADDLEHALALANGVPQGLVASLCTRDARARRRFADAIEAGILKLAPGALAIHPDAPFGGFKASAIGPPEHGVWDRHFYSRPQTLYGWTAMEDDGA